MNPSLEVLLFGLGLVFFGGGAVYLLLAAGERLGRWIMRALGNPDDHDKP